MSTDFVDWGIPVVCAVLVFAYLCICVFFVFFRVFEIFVWAFDANLVWFLDKVSVVLRFLFLLGFAFLLGFEKVYLKFIFSN